MDVEALTGELNDARLQLKQKEAELEMKVVALTQQMDENQTLSTQIERIEQESTAKIEVRHFFVKSLVGNQFTLPIHWHDPGLCTCKLSNIFRQHFYVQ